MARLIPFAAILLFLAPALARGAGGASTLARHLPDGANTIAIVRVSEILKTERARSEGWAEKAEHEFLGGAAVIPPWVDVLVVGSLVRPEVPEEVWTAAVLELPAGITLPQVARNEQAPIEDIVGKPAVRGMRDAYLVQLKPNLLGVLSPAVRQAASRWVRSLEAGHRTTPSDYLQGALDNSAHIVLAIDLQDSLSPDQVAAHLGGDERLKEHASLHDDLVKLVDDLRGVTFSAQIGDTIAAQVSIDFAENVGDIGPLVQRIFSNMLDDMGASLEELASAKLSASGQSIVLSTDLSDESLRRIMSLIVAPQPSGQVAKSASTSEATPTPPSPQTEESIPSRVSPVDVAAASQTYFRSIDRFLDDLRGAARNPSKYVRTAAWHDRFADRIEKLPASGVDPQLVDFGLRMARDLRGLAASLRGQAIQINADQKSIVYNVHYDSGQAAVNFGWGWGATYTFREPSYNVTSNLTQVRERQAAAVSAGAQSREQVWNMIDDDRTAVLRQMKSQYGDDFDVGRTRR